MTVPRHRDHAELRRALGAYTLGALDPAERADVDAHLEGCGACREELAELAALPGLLARLDTAEVAGGALVLADDHVDGVLAAIGAARRRERRRMWWWRAASVAAAAVLAGTLALMLLPRPERGERYVATAGAAVAVVEPRAWGMAVELRVERLPDEEAAGYVLWAVAADGHRAQVASWSEVDRPVTVVGACYLGWDDLDRLEVRTPDDELVTALVDA